jgi:Na+/phosphate symporter
MNRNERLEHPLLEGETLIERLKRYYGDYRKISDPKTSFSSALEAMTLSVIDRVADFAEQSDLSGIRNLVREYREIRGSIQASNDSVQERFEREYRERARQNEALI